MDSDSSPEEREEAWPQQHRGTGVNKEQRRESPESSGSPPSFHYPSSSSDEDAAPFVPEEPVSDGSVYEPSDKSSEGQPEAEPDEFAPPDAEDDLLLRLSPRKRLASDSLPRHPPPLKRQRGAFNRAYLALLNSDIEDAANHYVAAPSSTSASAAPGPPTAAALAATPVSDLPPSQLGLAYWTAAEKETFFEALARLGRDDSPGIARRVRTKGELEVRQYLALLNGAVAARRAAGELDRLVMADLPAAAELSAECCRALDEAADALALRQEAYEEGLERQKWVGRGADWLVTPANCRDFDDRGAFSTTRQGSGGGGAGLRSAELFRVESWLALSDRIFMNANYDEGNWQSVAGEPPSIRTTALEDFYTLALSVTRRLMSAAIYISMARIRSKKSAMPWTRDLVRKKDVEAAALSLGLKTDSKEFWAGCARRLRLDVYDDAAPTPDDEDARAPEPMSYAQVEKALTTVDQPTETPQSKEDDIDKESSDADLDSLGSSLDLETLIKEESRATDTEGEHSAAGEDPVDISIRLEAQEVTEFSALGYPDTHKARRALESRIIAEREQEDYADTLDRHLSHGEEKRLWSLLGRQPAHLPAKVEDLTRPVSRAAVDDIHPAGAGWRQHLEYISEWEGMLDGPKQRDRRWS
ncbi:uncharacterized protein E0L32_004832 [Thyridium curvatum]|uniref:Uncharacterized protein n=1 Tax=Thyridium curvatum TaxID=1093900 RepID=A0A507AYE4_9PEZI|nr:uncharacterized protein E0L32_004832 [Thyridium curvatum]TPX15002.1 hypothetical protein E0L32_004832 [Thyridium curvatum]